MKVRENQSGSEKKQHHEAIMEHGDSPGDSGVISGIIESGVLVIVGYDENQRQWKNGQYTVAIPGINKITGEIEGHYLIKYPNAVVPGFASVQMLGADGKPMDAKESMAYFAQLSAHVGAYAGSVEQRQYAGKDMPLNLCSFDTRPVERNKNGKVKNRNQMPKKFGLNFLIHEVIAKLHIAPPDKPEHGVVLVGEQAGYFGRMHLKRVSWEPKVRSDLGHIHNKHRVERVFSGTSASEQDQEAMADLIKQLSVIRPSIIDGASKNKMKISDYCQLLAVTARKNKATPVSITYEISGKWKNWMNTTIRTTDRDIKSGKLKLKVEEDGE